MKHNTNLKFAYFVLVICLVLFNVYFFYRLNKMPNNDELVENKCNNRTIKDLISSIGDTISYSSLPKDAHMFLRYNSTSCQVCVVEAVILLEDVFGKSKVNKELYIVNHDGSPRGNRGLKHLKVKEQFTDLDAVFTPYVCFTDSNNKIRFILQLHPEDYEYNRKLLSVVKNKLSK